MSQAEQILAYLKQYGTMTLMDSIRAFHCTCLSQRVGELKNRGYHIDTIMEPNEGRGKHARYVYLGSNDIIQDVVDRELAIA